MTRQCSSAITLPACFCLVAAAWGQMADPTGGEKLPMGHPDISMMEAPPAPAPTATGRLAVQALQGTPGGPAIGVAEVRVQLIHRGMLLDTLSGTLDEHGVVMFEDLAVATGFQPIVMIDYAGVTYQQVGALMDGDHSEQNVQVLCYEVMDDMPDWAVAMRHLMLSPAEQGVRVTELLVISSDGDRTWLGALAQDGARTVMKLALAAGARDVELGRGFSGWSDAAFESGELLTRRPLVPGRTELQFSYIVPAVEGSAMIDVVAPAPVERMMVIVPEGMALDAADSLRDGGTQAMGGKAVRFYVASDLAAGQATGFSVTGLGPAPAPAGEATAVAANAPVSTSGGVAKIVAAVGGIVLLLAAIIVFFRSSPKPAVGD